MRPAAAIVLLALFLAGCGNKAVDHAGFLKQADEICLDVAKRFGRLSTETNRARYYKEAKRINEEGAALLRGIIGPDETRTAARALADRIQAAARLFERAATLAARGGSTAAVEASIKRVSTDFVRRARALGLTECGGAPSPSPSP